MRNQKNIWKFLRNIVFFWVFFVVGFAWLFGSMEQAFFKTESNYTALLIAGLVISLLLTVPIIVSRFKTPIIEVTVPFDPKEDFSSKLKAAFDNVLYGLAAEDGSVSEWKCIAGIGKILCEENVTVKRGDTSVVLSGPKSTVLRLEKSIRGENAN